MSRKRASEWVDLTADNEEREFWNPSSSSGSRKQARSSQTGGPSSSRSQPQASQSLTAHDQWGVLENGEDEIIDLSQDVDEGHGWTNLGSLRDKIVGVRFYNGLASPGEQVMIKREPGNPYDSNAIRVNNVQGTQIGHLPKTIAAKLAPFLDARTLVIEAVLAGEKGVYDCPILLKFFGPAEPLARAALEAKLKRDRIILQKQKATAPKRPTQPTSSAPNGRGQYVGSSQGSSSQQSSQPEKSIQHFVAASERFRPRDVEKLVDEWGVGEEVMSNMPMADQPLALTSVLLPYQRQGLAWMLEKENTKLPEQGSSEVVQLWKRLAGRTNVFQNIATGYATNVPPSLAKGGILADDMGLGKTLQVISTIVAGNPGTTLIVAPMSVMSNWSQQIERHVKTEHALKVLTYHGIKKQMTHTDLAEYDVVITTYGTLSEEYLPRNTKEPEKIPRKFGLFSINWARVVLDEGHIIRNYKTKGARAASSLLATSRWVLTGTPIVNTIKDLYSMLKFLRITGGLEQIELFNTVLTRKLSYGDPEAEKVLQSIMKTMSLRRRKDMKFIDLKLTELSEYVHRIAFRPEERKKYDAFKAEAEGMVKKYENAKSGKGINAYRHLLEVLLRMRQVCCHWKLCGDDRVKDLLALLENDDIVLLSEENRAALQVLLQLSIDSQEECSICLEDLHNPVITACKHVFGGECIERTIELQHKCPMCRAHLEDKQVLVHPAVDAKEEANIDTNTQSSKTEALMSILHASRKDPLSKVVIFSQWTSFLNVIQHQLEEAGMKYTRIDGTMTAATRDKAMTALESDPDTRILLASLAVCSVGLNLVSADTVIMADSWWAPAIEDQAVDRVHRLGQTRPCTVWRLIMEDSIEERVIEIQASKRKLVGQAFQEKTKGDKAKTTRMGDILKLLQ